METQQALAIIFMILLVGYLLFLISMDFASILMKKKVSTKSLLNGFRLKMWMTAGLGILFFGFYFSAIFLGSHLLDSETLLNIFFIVHKHPLPFAYLGLLIFICISTLIYLARMLIKSWCNKH